jgi:ABC-type glycerol-3-phosphate transport system substrate-binding protein
MTTKLRRAASVTAAIAVVSIALSGCAATPETSSGPTEIASSGPAEIEFWTMPFASLKPGQILALVNEFNDSQDEVNVSLTLLEWSDGRDKIRQAVSAGNAPEVFLAAPLDLAYVDAGLLSSASELGYTQAEIDAFGPVTEAATIDGELYAFPLSVYADVLYVNMTVLDRYGHSIPTNWDELYETSLDITTKSTAEGNKVYGFQVKGMDDHANAINHSWPMFFEGAGGDLVSADGQSSTQNTPAGIAALEYLKQFYDNGVVDAGVSAQNGFIEGDVAMFAFSQGLLSVIGSSALQDEWTIALLPDGPERPMSYIGPDALVATAGAENPDAVGTFMKWITSPKNTALYMQTGGVQPYKFDALPAEVLADVEAQIAERPLLKVVYEALEVGSYEVTKNESIGQAARWAAQKTYIVAALTGQTSFEDALAQIDLAINQAIR